MEWVEITAPTVEEARDRALDQLGIDEQDVEVEVLEEPRPGLFGRLRGQARIRARVRPSAPRPKVDRRDRRRRGAPSSSDSPEQTTEAEAEVAATVATRPEAERPHRGGRRGGGRDREQLGARGDQETMPELTIDEQAEVVSAFLLGLADAFAVDGVETSTERVEDATVEVRLQGGDLGLLIGPKGATLQTVQELARTVVQRRGGGTQEGRIRIDIAGYRQRRREALARFTEQVAASVLETGTEKALEPMNAADRKVVHDTANGIDGVRTISQGEEPRRRVILLPDAS